MIEVLTPVEQKHHLAELPTTRRLLESILAVEEQHADELADLLQEVGMPSGLAAKTRAALA